MKVRIRNFELENPGSTQEHNPQHMSCMQETLHHDRDLCHTILMVTMWTVCRKN